MSSGRDPGAYINRLGTAVPAHDVHLQFIDWASARIAGDRERMLFRRMAERSGIKHRWSVLPPGPSGGSPVDQEGFYAGSWPSTATRMEAYAEQAPKLALQAIGALREQVSIEDVTHLVVASCTGFMAPGVDQVLAAELGLPHVERTLVGFMGCYAAVSALRLARHIVRSEPEARVLVVTVELSSLHLQQEDDPARLLAMLQFGDGAAAALVTAEPSGFAIPRLFSLSLPDTSALIRWTIGDEGFAMHLSGEVPGRIAEALADPGVSIRLTGEGPPPDCWAVHAGGRSILDAVERGLNLDREALTASREILARYGNMSSSTLMFVLASLLEQEEHRSGIAIAFGPGLAAEGFAFERAP